MRTPVAISRSTVNWLPNCYAIHVIETAENLNSRFSLICSQESFVKEVPLKKLLQHLKNYAEMIVVSTICK